jgi:uncharacterized protein
MRGKFPVIDSDGHTLLPPTLWNDYLDPAFRQRVNVTGPNIYVDGVRSNRHPDELRETLNFTPEKRLARYGEMARRNFDPPSMLMGMDIEGIDLSITYDPLYAFWVDRIDPALAAAMVRAYNRWICVFSAEAGGRIRGAAPLPIMDVDLSLQELDFAWNLGMRAFWVRPNPINGRLLGDRAYDRLYAALEERDAPFSIHEGSGACLPSIGADRFFKHVDAHACCHPMEQQMAMLSMMTGGVFDRFPKLRVGFMESGCSWLPYWLYRMDEHVQLTGAKELPDLKALPSEYFRRQCYIACEPDEELLRFVVEALGDDNILFSSDFPHPDCKYPHILDSFLGLKGISDESKRKILAVNAARFYNLDLAQLNLPLAAAFSA